MRLQYKAILSSDWNECLAPCGPFDCISFCYPHLAADLQQVFRQYTSSMLSLSDAADQLEKLVPEPITPAQMDAYLDASFVTYPGVSVLIDWCANHHILFMINTTGMTGYFQRVFAKGLLPCIPVLAAHPMIRFKSCESDPPTIFDLFEIQDKAAHTQAIVKRFNIPGENVILMGDSGGDGPHFEWGANNGSYLIGSMTKASLQQYCHERGVRIHRHFGVAAGSDESNGTSKEMSADFQELIPIIAQYLQF